jgi:chromatin segregation and condensation protein Rec8/ScpA/Scc1 (kleisin family)
VVAYFLAMLELVRWGALSITQEDPLSTIRVAHRDDAMEEELDRLTRHSEWGGPS